MKLPLLLLVASIVWLNQTYAQNGLSGSIQPLKIPVGTPSSGKISFTLVLKDSLTGKEILASNILMNSRQMQNLHIMNSKEKSERFGIDKVEHQVWIITPKSSAIIVPLSKFLTDNGVPRSQRLPLLVDHKVLPDTSNVYVDKNSIRSIKVYTDSVSMVINRTIIY